MTESFMPECLAKYGVVPSLSDPVGSVKTLHALAWKLDAEIKRTIAASAATDSNVPKVVSPFDAEATNDKQAKATAERIIVVFLAACERETTKNHNVAYWLAELDKRITAFNTSEREFYRWQSEKSDVVSFPKNENGAAGLKSDRKDVVQFVQRLTVLMPTILDELSGTDLLKKAKSGATVLNLPNIQGRQGGDAESVGSGKYGRLSHMVWTIGEETFPAGTETRILLRHIFHGVDRVGVRPGNLYDAFTSAQDKQLHHMIKPGESVTFELNHKNVTATFPAGSEELTDEEDESDESEEQE